MHITLVQQKFSFKLLFSFCFIFCQFHPGVAHKTAAYKKDVHCHKNSCICLKCRKFHAKVQNLPSIEVSSFLVTIQSWKCSLEKLKYAKMCTWVNNFWEERIYEPVCHHNFRFSFALNYWFKGELHSNLWNLTFINKLQFPLIL